MHVTPSGNEQNLLNYLQLDAQLLHLTPDSSVGLVTCFSVVIHGLFNFHTAMSVCNGLSVAVVGMYQAKGFRLLGCLQKRRGIRGFCLA